MDEAIKECIPVKEVQTSRKRTNQNKPNQKPVVENQKKKTPKARFKQLMKCGENNSRELQEVDREYRQINKQVRNETRKAIRNNERTIASHVKENPEVFWKHVQDKSTKKSGIPDLYINGDNTVMTNTVSHNCWKRPTYWLTISVSFYR